ncbi:hypothetical protein AXF42_Ash021386 [Apostasia shenzhenica]|uniref:Uncharacterized protein n=1 Tax=Apostasia shenzhenica TaxID=1088818 RepID=A0A2H9ZYW0_9ASPA|nr:hypothetical protein AXF42_Ash021386 [Apostasia shenzhenica]
MIAGMVASVTLGAIIERAKLICGLDWTESASTQRPYLLSRALLLLTLPESSQIIAHFWFKVGTWSLNRKATP